MLSLAPAEKTQYFVHLSFSSTLQLINGISSDLQKLLKYFIAAFLQIPFATFDVGWATVFYNNLVLYLKELKLSVFAIFLFE